MFCYIWIFILIILPRIHATNPISNKLSLLNSGDSDDDKVPTLSIIDVLSSNESYSILLKILQKSDLIDYVNELANVTFLAPLNQAFQNRNMVNIKITKEQLDRFIIDEPIFRENVDGIKLISTLNTFGSPYIKKFKIPLLLDHRIIDDDNEIYYVENADVVSEDFYLPNIDTVVLKVNDLLLNPKESVCEYFQNALNRNTGNERFKIFSSLVLSDNTCKFGRISNVTFFIPSDNSIGLNHVERKYLLNVRGLEDKNLLLSNFLVNGIIGGNLQNNSVITHSWNMVEISISSSYQGDEIIVNDDIHATTSNFLLSDGIIHYFENQIFDYNNENFPKYTPRKYLIGLDYEDFVDEIDFRGLSELIDDTSINQTIFVSNDYKIMGNLQNQLLYHFIDENEELNMVNEDKKLLTSKFCLTNEFCQKIKFEKSSDGKTLLLNSNVEILNSVPYQVGNTSIYILDDDISLPSKLQTAIASELTGFGKSIEFFKKFNFLKTLSKDVSSYTIFFPSSKLWNNLDLTLDYLMSNNHILKQVIENLIIQGLIYHDFKGSKEFETLSNHKINITKDQDQDLLIIDDLVKTNISFDNEILYSNGVVHPVVDELPFPKGLEITNHDLLTTVDSIEFEKIIEKLNLTFIFDLSLGYSIMLPPSNLLLQENITSSLTDIKYLEKFAQLHILPPGSLDMILDCYSDTPIDKNQTSLIPTLMNNIHFTCRKLASGGMMLSITEGTNNEVRILRHGLSLNDLDFNSGVLLLDRPVNPSWLHGHNDKLYLHLPFIAILLGILIGVICAIITFGCCLMLTLGNSNNIKENPSYEESNNNNNNNYYLPDEGENRVEHIVSVNERMPLLNDEENQIVNNNNHNNTTIQPKPITNSSGGTENGFLVNKGRKLGRHYNSFDARYSTNASAFPIDVNYEQNK
jgi:uncharacterized surface protein with fasciclin (FAS1) repeats